MSIIEISESVYSQMRRRSFMVGQSIGYMAFVESLPSEDQEAFFADQSTLAQFMRREFEKRFGVSADYLAHSATWREFVGTGDKIGYLHTISSHMESWIKIRVAAFMRRWE